MLVSIAAKKVIDHTNVRNRKKPVVVVVVAVANRVSFYLMRSNDNGKKII